MKLVDVNVLIYAINPSAPAHAAVRAWWLRSLSGDEPIALCWAVISGFLRISTNPRALERPLSASDAIERVDARLDHPTICLLAESPRHWTVFQTLLRSANIRGSEVNDAHLAALAITHGATLASCDSDFARFPELRWENPAVAQ